MRVLFAGTPEFSVPPLQALLDSEHEVIGVYTQPDRPAGRGRKLLASPVKQLAQQHRVPVFQPSNFKAENDLIHLESLKADLMVVVAYGLLLPQRMLDAPRLGCVNIHASLLPRWRGAAPIQRAIAAGDQASGITIMQMEAGLDTGPMHLVRTCPIETTETGQSLHDKLSRLGAEALMQALPAIDHSGTSPRPQDDAQAIYAHKLSKEEALIDWNDAAVQIERRIRAFNPWPVAQTRYGDAIVRIWTAEIAESGDMALPGTVIRAGKEGVDVATGQGALRITCLQMPGKRAMAVGDFLNAHCVEGVRFGS